MMTAIVRVDDVVDHVDPSLGVTVGHVSKQSRLKCSVESLDERGFDVVVQTRLVPLAVRFKQLLYLDVVEFRTAIRLQLVGDALGRYLFERRRHRRPSLVFDGHGERVSREHVDAGEYVGVTVVTGRQISHVLKIDLEQIVDSFSECFTAREFLHDRFVQRVGSWAYSHLFTVLTGIPLYRVSARTPP
jgi:hypothetical protein